MKKIKINTEYITLGQLLKIGNLINSGGEAKYYLLENDVYVNDEETIQRGKKLYKGYIIKVENKTFVIE